MFAYVNISFAHNDSKPQYTATKNLSKEISISPESYVKSKFTIELFNGRKIQLIRKNIIFHEKQNYITWVGFVKNVTPSEVFLTFKNNKVFGNILVGEQRYSITTKGNKQILTKLLVGESPKHAPSIIPEFKPSLFQRDITPNFNGTVIDVMVMYTPNVETRWGVEGIEAKIINAVDMANQAYINSGIDMRINLVHTQRFEYTETGNMATTFNDFQGISFWDPTPKPQHLLRDQYGADQMVLISGESTYCGLGTIMSTADVNFAPYAYAVVHDDSVYSCLSNNTLAHELGHNQGNAHNVEDAGHQGAYPYSYGYRTCVSGGFRTIMSYNCGTPKIAYFSNPNILYNGEPIGAELANNALSMTNTKDIVASFKPSVVTSLPKAPINLTYSATVAGEVTLSWDDKSEFETGFRIERSVESINCLEFTPETCPFTEIATVGSDVDTFTDTGLLSAMQYYYRVRAFNSAGNSVYSNPVLATTIYVPEDLNPPVVTVSTPTANQIVGNSFTISGTATDDVGVVKMRILVDGVVVKTTYTGSISKVYDSTNLTIGNHNVVVKAWDAANNVKQKTVVVVKQ